MRKVIFKLPSEFLRTINCFMWIHEEYDGDKIYCMWGYLSSPTIQNQQTDIHNILS